MIGARGRVIETLERIRVPVTAALVAHEAGAPLSTARHVLAELCAIGIVARSRPFSAWRYELVRE